MYLGLVEALQRRLLSCCMAISRVRLQECRVDKFEGSEQAGIGLVDLVVPQSNESKNCSH